MSVRMCLVGYGDVGQRKFTPALLDLVERTKIESFPFMKQGNHLDYMIVDVDPEKKEEVRVLNEEVQKRNLPISISFICPKPAEAIQLLSQCIDEKTLDLVYIASPNRTHARYLDFFLSRAKRVLVEKPLVDHISSLLEVESNHTRAELESMRLIDHYLLKPPIVDFLANYEDYLEQVGLVRRIDMDLIEPGLIRPSRAWLYYSGMIRDLAVHYLSFLLALYERGWALTRPDNIRLLQTLKARYNEIPPEIQDPVETAARLLFWIGGADGCCTVGKGAGYTRKEFRIHGTEGLLTINTPDGTTTFTTNGETVSLYPKRGADTFKEYEHLMKSIFTDDLSIGLPYHLAKAQSLLMEETDEEECATYDVGDFPFD